MIRIGWLALAAMTVVAAIFLERRQVIPQPWGYVVYDRITGNYEACEVRRPDDYLADFARKGATTVPNPAFDPKAGIDDAFKAITDQKPDPTQRAIPGPFDQARAVRETSPIATCVVYPRNSGRGLSKKR